MKIRSTFLFAGAALAAAVLTSGCRTVHTEGAAVPPPDAQVAPGPVLDDAIQPGGEIRDASLVGTPGTYQEVVGAEEGDGAKTFEIESDGLKGRTGRHVSPPPPPPEPAPVVPAPDSAGAGVYVVQEGDIFGRIAQRHGVSQKALRDANPSLKDPNKIRPKMKLNLPPRGTGLGAAAPAAKPAAPKKKAAATLPPKAGYTVYVVKENEILGRIAKAHGTTVKAIMEANGLSDPRKLRAGQPIYVPSAAGAAPAPAAPAAAPAAPAVPPPAAPEAPASIDDEASFGFQD